MRPISWLVASLALPLISLLPAQQPHARPRPLVFEPTPVPGEFFARGTAGVTYRCSGARIVARTPTGEVVLRFAGARQDAVLEPLRPTGGVSHYYFERDPAQWRSNVPHYRELRARDIRPGVDLVHHRAGGDLEFDLVLRPRADWRSLRIGVQGARGLRLCADGAVALAMQGGELQLRPPVVYQVSGGVAVPVPCHYVLDGGAIAFAIGAHDPDRALTIDPVVTFCTLLGGTMHEVAKGVAVDRFGNMAVTGTTTSADFPLRNPLAIPLGPAVGFITKFDATGHLVFSTYFGGTTGSTVPVDVGFDPDGQVLTGGNVNNAILPTTLGVVQPSPSGADWFFVCLLADGSLSWCTYYGGPGAQAGMKALKVLDIQRGSVVAVGTDTLPLMPNAYSGLGNIGVAGIFGGNVLFVSTMCGFGGTPTAIDVTAQGHICLTGTTIGLQTNLPTTALSFQQFPRTGGSFEGFVFVFFGTADSLVYATFVGGSLNDVPQRIRATTGPGAVYCTIAGETISTDYPLRSPVQAQKGAGTDAFVTRLDGLGRNLDFSTYLGGSATDTVRGLDLDASGHTIAGGSTSSLDLRYVNPMKVVNQGSNSDVWLARFTPDGAALTFFTAWGGSGGEELADLDVGPAGEIVVAGHTGAANMPTTPNALPIVLGSQDAFLAQIDPRSATSYGAGTAGYWNFVPVLAGGGPDQAGTTARFNVHDGRAQAPGVLALGVGRTAIAFAGGQILTLPLVTVPLVLRGSRANALAERGGGYLHFGFPIPANPTLRNLTTNWQAVFADAAGVGGVTLTNGVELVLR